MKHILWISITFLSLVALADSGGEEYIKRRYIRINCFEPNLNLVYKGIDDTIIYNKGKKEIKKQEVTNVAIYNIQNKQTSYIFKDTTKRIIIGFTFETSYLDENKSIEFNDSYFSEPGSYSSSNSNYFNNSHLNKREISNNIIIITQDIISKNETLWICDKYGNNLTKLKEFDSDWDWNIDVKNQMFIINKQVKLKMEFESFKY